MLSIKIVQCTNLLKKKSQLIITISIILYFVNDITVIVKGLAVFFQRSVFLEKSQLPTFTKSSCMHEKTVNVFKC